MQPTPVHDFQSNVGDVIVHISQLLSRSIAKRKLFSAVYYGKKTFRTVEDIRRVTGLSRKRVLTLAKQLSDQHVFGRETQGGRIKGYTRRPEIHHLKKRILAAATNKRVRAGISTKAHPKASVVFQRITQLARQGGKHERLTVDDFDDLDRVKAVKPQGLNLPSRLGETRFRDGLARLFGERGRFRDWPGELSDVSTSQSIIQGHRRHTAIALKGPATKGILTPKKMGVNGDQLQRLLLRAPGDVFLVVYEGQIGDAVLEQMERFAALRSVTDNRKVWFGVIDRVDCARLRRAYPRAFR